MRLAFCCAPGISSAKTSTLLPPIGSFSICALPTVVEIVVDVVSITVRPSFDRHGFGRRPRPRRWIGTVVGARRLDRDVLDDDWLEAFGDGRQRVAPWLHGDEDEPPSRALLVSA